jgi:hypothetical protein
MITLNSEKGLVQVENWEDIRSRPGFTVELNPKEHKLKAIIGRYVFKDEIKCGLSDCHTPHNRGYIVVTETGAETNIGKDCGRKYFGVEFEMQSRQFERDNEMFLNRIALGSFSFQLDALEDRIHSLRRSNRGATWVHRHTSSLLSPGKGCPGTVVSRVCAMVRARQNAVVIDRLATDSEVEAMEGAQNRTLPRPFYISERIAEIAGFSALYPENDLRELLTIKLEDKIRLFRSLDIDSMSQNDLRHWSQWTGTVAETFDRAQEAVNAGQKLLVRDNLLPFVRILSTASDIATFRSYLKDLDR